eukprot:scaffold109416_cov33-Tisochrysis_lutea.AAC.5
MVGCLIRATAPFVSVVVDSLPSFRLSTSSFVPQLRIAKGTLGGSGAKGRDRRAAWLGWREEAARVRRGGGARCAIG